MTYPGILGRRSTVSQSSVRSAVHRHPIVKNPPRRVHATGWWLRDDTPNPKRAGLPSPRRWRGDRQLPLYSSGPFLRPARG